MQNNQQYLITADNKTISIQPQKGRQEQFYNSTADVVFYGGAAGGGKSTLLLADAVRPENIKISSYNAVIFRQTYAEIANPGGLLDESRKIYPTIGGQFIGSPHNQWKFQKSRKDEVYPKVSFRYLQHDKDLDNYQGAQFDHAAFDELTHIKEEHFFWVASRCRSVSGIKPKIRATMNPDSSSWVAKFIDWYWNPVTGYPIPERAGIIRYFVRLNGVVHWGDSAQELKQKFDLKEKLKKSIPDDKKDQFLDENGELVIDDIAEPKSFTFIPATIWDNPILVKINPQYLMELLNLHPVKQEQLLYGNWLIKYDSGKVFDRSWFKIVDTLPSKIKRSVRFWDMAATAKEINDQACYTSGLKLAELEDGSYCIIDLVVGQLKAGDVEAIIKNYAMLDGKLTEVAWELEGGSSGKIVEEVLIKEIKKENPKSTVSAIKPQGDKLARSLPVATASHQGRISILRDTWNNQLLNATQAFDGSKKEPPVNDIIDSLSGAFNYLRSLKKSIPSPDSLAPSTIPRGQSRYRR